MYKVLDVAKYIIKYCNESDYIISNLKLQKILYFVQAEFLICTDNACFSEDIRAWDFGPVIPEVYYKYKVYGSANIPYVKFDEKISLTDKNLINGIIDECSQYSASHLVEITCNQEPWINAYKSHISNIIEPRNIKQYFEYEHEKEYDDISMELS